jgi:hypothetical protein
LRVSFVAFVLALSTPSGLADLTTPPVPPTVWQLRDGRRWDRRWAQPERRHELRMGELRRYDPVSREAKSTASTRKLRTRAARPPR